MTAVHHHGAPVTIAPRGGTPAWRLLLTLALAGGLSGWLVATVYNITLPRVERYAAARMNDAIREVLKAPARWDTLYLVNGAVTKTPPGDARAHDLPMAFVGYDAGGRRVGVAVTGEEPGFQELMTLMIGFDPGTGTLLGFKVLDQKQTPGLGDKVEKDSSFGVQFDGKQAPLRGIKGRPGQDPSEVQTITGATISSRAVIRIINDAVAKWRPLLQAYSGGSR
jgi:electron transport complex protein RnfG